MAFAKQKSDSNGLNKKFGSTIAADENSNINWQKSSQRIGTINGRVKFGKQSISSLNKGVGGSRGETGSRNGD